MRFVQQTSDCSDFDVILDGEETPAFRVLLPEVVYADGLDSVRGAHVIPGAWEWGTGRVLGRVALSEQIKLGVTIIEEGGYIRVALRLTNSPGSPLTNVSAEVCVSANHLPGEPGWCNEAFLPNLPLDRDAQGRAWFEHVTPHNLRALTARGWVDMHPCADRPDPDSVPTYSFSPSDVADARACAVGSHDGSTLLFQAWDAPCRYVTPCPGNACMHLIPQVAKALAPGATATINGVIGVFAGTREELAARLAT